MNIFLVSESCDEESMVIGTNDPNMAIISPLLEYLDEDESVELARFIEPHPELEPREISVVVSSGTARDAFIRASKRMSSCWNEVAESVDKHPGSTSSVNKHGEPKKVYAPGDLAKAYAPGDLAKAYAPGDSQTNDKSNASE